jgi:hypothetical protein
VGWRVSGVVGEMKTTFRGIVDDGGKLKLERPEAFTVAVGKLAGKPVFLSIKVNRPQRSTNQNAFYRGVVVPICAEEFGYSKEGMHIAFAMKFLTIQADPENGRPFESVKSTTELDTVQWESYIQDIRELVWDMSEIRIPLPNEVPLEAMFA